MDRKYIDDHHIVARYLADRLADDEREAFEAYYVEHPEIVQEMEAAARFKAGLRQLRHTGELDRLIDRPSPIQRWRLLAAAAVLAAVFVGAVVFNRYTRPGPLLAATPATLASYQGRELSVVSTQQIFRTRSSGADATIQLPTTPSAIKLEIQPEFDSPSGAFAAKLHHVDENERKQLAAVDALSPDADGFVVLYLDSTHLTPGLYELELMSVGRADPPSIFSVRVVP